MSARVAIVINGLVFLGSLMMVLFGGYLYYLSPTLPDPLNRGICVPAAVAIIGGAICAIIAGRAVRRIVRAGK